MPIFRRQDDAPRDRTPEERERARAERNARRAARGESIDFPSVAPVPEEPEVEEERAPQPPEEPGFAADPRDFGRPPVEEEPWPEPPRFGAEPEPILPEPESIAPEPEPVAPEPEPVAPEPEPIAPEPEPEPFALQPTVAFDPLTDDTGEGAAVEPSEPARPVVEPEVAPWEADPALEPELPEAIEREPEPEPEPVEPPPIVPPAARRARSGRTSEERPVAPKRVSARERRLPPTPPPPGTPAFSKRRRRRGRILAFIALLLFALLLLGINSLFEPFKGEGGETVTVRIPPNSSVAEVGELLADNDIVANDVLFTLRARLAGADLKAGTYRLQKDSSYGDALDALDADPAAPRTVKVTIPEGRSRSETAPLVQEAGIDGSYVKASATHPGFRPRKYGAPRDTKTLEGFLFPATYELSPGAQASKLVDQQLEAFADNVAKVDMKRAKRRNLTTYDVLIIASMIEREATLARERPIISAVIHNRLRQGMPLGIDATIRYAVKNWSEPLKESELQIDSPFNTRRRTGLPPTPIGSPGLDSIKAAANPANVNFLFYVVKPNGDGAHNFSSTDEQFQRDVDAYNAERERRDGQSPADSG